MTALIEAGERGLALAAKALEISRSSGVGRVAQEGTRLDVPLRPGLILASGGNYSDHRDEKEEAPLAGREPEFFFKTPHTVVAPGDPLELDPRVTKKLDYEVELAVVIGKKGRHIPEDRVAEHRRVVGAYDLPTALPPGSDPVELVEVMRRDKKALTGLTFVLDGPDGVELVAGVEQGALDEAFARVKA